ncbi:MAG: hypothetical protein ABIE55_02965 [Candidatus Aenigmatarchaeota archaeon]
MVKGLIKYVCIFLVLLSIQGVVFAQNTIFNEPFSDSTINGTIVFNATTDYDCENATFFYSDNPINPWQEIGSNTTNGIEFTLIFNTNSLSDGIYNFTVNSTNSTHETFDTSTNVAIDNPPKWFNETTSLTSGLEYSPNQNYQFNITWTDGSLDQVFFESNYTLNASEAGTMTNYTNPTITNSSGVFSIVLSDIPAQSFLYRWIGNDSSSSENSTEESTYIISENSSIPIILTLDGAEEDKSYNLNQNATFEASLNIPNKNIYLNSSSPCWTNLTSATSLASNTTNLTCSGFYSLTAYWNGDENYTSSEVTYYFDTIAPQYSNMFPSLQSGEYASNKTYWFNITWTAATIEDVQFGFKDNSSEFSLYNSSDIQSSSGIYSVNITDLLVGDYTYFWCANRSSTENITSCTNNTMFNVTKKAGSLLMFFDNNPITDGASTTVTCSKLNGDSSSIITLYKDSVSVDTNTISVVKTYSGTLTEGTYSFTCTMNESQNYTLYTYPPTNLVVDPATFIIEGGQAGTDNTPASTSGAFTITPSESKITVGVGSSKEMTFVLKNTRTLDDVLNIVITVSGISPDWYSLDKETIAKLRHGGGSETIKMILNIPENASKATYSMRVKASGEDIDGSSSMVQTSPVQLVVGEPSEEVVEAVLATQEAAPENETEEGAPTGFLPFSSEYVPYMVLLVGAIVSIMVFLKRDDITAGLMGISGVKAPKRQTRKKVEKKAKKPSFRDFDWKLSVGLKKEKKPKTLEIPSAEREEVLEREISKDIKELKNIMEAEKRIKKRKK